MSNEQRRGRLVMALRSTPTWMRHELEKMKREGAASLQRDDWLWCSLLAAASTLGNSRGFDGLIRNQENFEQVSFDALEVISDADRLDHLEGVLRRAKVRMPALKARRLASNFQIISRMGGPAMAKRNALSSVGRQGKLAFMKQFHGIGDKYSRDIWMDAYHPDFHDCVALDSRVQSITRALDYSFTSYAEHERFYLAIAHAAALNGWELDRLLYNYRDHFLTAIDGA